MMKVLYLPMPDRIPDAARKPLQHRANHSANCTFWLRQRRAVMSKISLKCDGYWTKAKRQRGVSRDGNPCPPQRRQTGCNVC
jgi:hypothetical protein